MPPEQKKPRKKSLMRAFAKAVAGVVLGLTMLYGGWHLAFYAGRGEKLTSGEKNLLTGIFGKEINTSEVRKHFRDTSSITHVIPGKIGMVPPPFSHIDFFGEKVWSRDYSQDTKYKFGLFAHEATHCWQGQTMTFPLHDFGRYDYKLAPGACFNNFGTEQQADIIEDYAKTWLYKPTPAAKHTAQDTLLMKVVENRFPQAQKTRTARQLKKS